MVQTWDGSVFSSSRWHPSAQRSEISFATDTADPDTWVYELLLDCAVQATQPDAPGDRLALIAWTGP